MHTRSARTRVSRRFEGIFERRGTYRCWDGIAAEVEIPDDSTWLCSSCHERGSRCYEGRNGSASRHGGGLEDERNEGETQNRGKERKMEGNERRQNERQDTQNAEKAKKRRVDENI